MLKILNLLVKKRGTLISDFLSGIRLEIPLF